MKTEEKPNEGKPDHNLVPARLPEWLPTEAMRYLVHTETGTSIREIARQFDCHASTVMRQIRRFENRRDDPLVDEALTYWGRLFAGEQVIYEKDQRTMSAPIRHFDTESPDQILMREARRILRRLCETGSVLAVAKDMDKAVVVRDQAGGKSSRTAVVDREIAQSMALKGWILCTTEGAETARIVRYQISAKGRSALKRLLADAENANAGFGEAPAFHIDRPNSSTSTKGDSYSGGRVRTTKYNMGETPLSTLARRKDKDGNPFIDAQLVSAGERLHEDFELAHMGPKMTQNWESFMLGSKAGNDDEKSIKSLSSAARERVSNALQDLGPGLGDVVLRCCCYLEGMEMVERRMGWSARSGKIVLRIALQRLKRHYDEKFGPHGPMIG